ncbi:MAG TPA: PAS domain S-box protein [Balneolaceae bacterium]|nr:PAS domain S-box protein [Balneolaceae bacterium]
MDKNGTSFFKEQPIFILEHDSLDIIDVNDCAVNKYGYTRDEFCLMNVNDLGIKRKRTEVIEDLNKDGSADKIWTHESKDGEQFYIQFTYHVFNYQGRPVKFAIAHDVDDQVEQQETRRIKFPKFVIHESDYPLAEIEWDNNFEVRNWSEKAEELFGWREDEVVGRKNFFRRMISDDEYKAVFDNLKKAVSNHDAHYTTEVKIETKEREVITCKWYNSLIYDEHRDLYSIHSLITDITGQKQSENLFRALSEESLVGVYLIQDGIFRYVNPRFAQIFGYERDEIINKLKPADLTYPPDSDLVLDNLRQRMDGEVDYKEYDFRGLSKQGDVIHVSVYGSAIKYIGKPAVIGTLLDITENKETMQKYQASVESFQDLFDSISDAIYIQNKEGQFLEVNQGAVEMYGYDHDSFIGKTSEMLVAPGKVDLAKTEVHIQKALDGQRQSFEWWGRRKNGEVFPLEVVANPGTYFGEDVVITIARDISDRYQAEEQLRENEEMFRQLFQNAPIPIAFMDKRQEIRSVNTAFSETFGYETEEIRGLDIDELIVPEGETEIAHGISDTIFGGETAFYSGKRLTKNGSLLDVLIYGVPVIVNGKTVAIYGIYVDITDRKQAEEQLKKSLKEKEVLLSEIHHRVKNNLAVITGLLELQVYNTNSDEATDVLRASQMRINSIALIHEKLYQNENLSEISFDIYLKQLVEAIIQSMEIVGTDVEIEIDAEPIELTVNQAIPCGLILNELITNAYKHAFVDRETGNIKVLLTKDNSRITLQVQDDGVGIPENTDLENPKSLGVKLIRTLSEQLSGEAEFINSNPGTTFRLEFDLED